MRCRFRFYLIVFASTLFVPCFGQNDLLNTATVIRPDIGLTTKKDYLDHLSVQYGWTFSYNASLLKVDDKIKLNYQISTLKSILEQIFFEEQLVLITQPPKKIIIQTKGRKTVDYLLNGTVLDHLTGESIYGAIIVEKNSGTLVFTNEKGYFVMAIPKGEAILEVSYLAYKKNVFTVDIKNPTKVTIRLENDNLLDTIVIDNPKSRIQLVDGGNIIDVFKTREFKSIIGETDVVNNARILPGVQSGGEGQSGLYVRGGTPDQNLVLLDGVALYETCHLAGISSIFMDESVKESSFVMNGFPARYGGRLSSVMDVQLKEGDKKRNNITISAGLAGAKLHLNGPIVNAKTTYTLTARTSWVNFYVNNLLRKFTKYDDIIINYHDILGKITRHFSPSNSLSFTLYNGSDRLRLTKNNVTANDSIQYSLKVFDRNAINWGTTVGSLKWNFLATDKLSLKLQAGYIKYKNGTRASYIFETTTPFSTKTDELDVLTSSNITDLNIRADADYYVNDRHVIKSGINVMRQNFNPTVKQSTVILQGNAENIIDNDSLIKANQIQIYLEDNYKIHPQVLLYGGLHYSTYIQNTKTYSSLQPRFKVIWTPFENHMLSGAYSQMSQFIHLLSNSGLGLPADLWVPSTEKIAPQDAEQWSLGYTLNFTKSLYFNIGGYTKQYKNSLEYTSPIELFYFLINDQNIVPIYNTSRDWERNVLTGTSESKGLEMLLHKSKGKTKGWTSLTWSKTEKSFNEINDGIPFPANYDKTWDLSAGLSHQFTERFSMGANFVYNTGNSFSLATEEYNSIEGLNIKLLNPNGRNNYRLPNFHQLSANAAYTITKENYKLNINFNIYNVYNRLNAYFIYIYENPAPPYNIFLKKVSILPFTPSFNISVSF